jgi:hypothetical protein
MGIGFREKNTMPDSSTYEGFILDHTENTFLHEVPCQNRLEEVMIKTATSQCIISPNLL